MWPSQRDLAPSLPPSTAGARPDPCAWRQRCLGCLVPTACVCCLCEAAALCPPPCHPASSEGIAVRPTYMIELDKFSMPRHMHVSVSLHEARCQRQTPASRLMRLSAQPQSSMLRTPSRHYGWFQIVSCDRFCGKPFTSSHILHTPLSGVKGLRAPSLKLCLG